MKNTYINAYKLLCESHKHLKEEWKPRGSGLARHRINPGHNGGEYVQENCTYLTLKQHALAHWLLWKIHHRPEDHLAYKLMLGVDPKHYPNRLGRKLSEEHKAKISATLKGRERSEETKAKLSAALKGRRTLSDESIAKMAATKKGRPVPEEVKAKISAALKGRKRSEETKAKISATLKGRKKAAGGSSK